MTYRSFRSVLLLCLACCLPLMASGDGFPERPAGTDATDWARLQQAVAKTITPQQRLSKGGAAGADGEPDNQTGLAVALVDDTAVIGAPNDDVGGASNAGSAYVYVRSGGNWSLQAKLVASDGTAGDTFGNAVAVSGDTVLVGASFATINGRFAQGAVYVFTRSAGTWSEQTKLTASNGGVSDRFGFAVALSGQTALISAFLDSAGASSQGSAYVFTRNGTAWTQQAQLVASDGAGNDLFGSAVALDGDTALIGAYLDDIGSNGDQGSAYVFVRNGITWSQQAKLIASDGGSADELGTAVALSGNTALLGSPSADSGVSPERGAAYAFVRSGVTWTEQAKLVATDGAQSDRFGSSVAVHGDTALVGAELVDIGGTQNVGATYVFTRDTSVWSQQAKLNAADAAASDTFGRAVALSADTALVGAPLDNVGRNLDQGSAYTFVRSAGTWAQQAKLQTGDGAASDVFGISISLSGDTALIAAAFDDLVEENQGQVYVFVRDGSNWVLQAQLTASDAAGNDQFGLSVALSGDTALIGADNDDNINGDQGAAYVFVRNAGIWTQQAKLLASDGAANDQIGNSVALSGDTALVGGYRDDVGANPNQGSAYVFVRSGSVWSEQARLVASDGQSNDEFGAAVALEGETALVGARGDDIANANQGSAYVFVRSGSTWTQQAKLIATDNASNDAFGGSVALSADTALIGASGDDIDGRANQGSAVVFVRSGNSWTEQAKLLAIGGVANDNFGASVAVSGEAALIGANGLDLLGINNRGGAFVFLRSGSVWSQVDLLISGDARLNDQIGGAVALLGSSAFIGAAVADGPLPFGNRDEGAAYSFTLFQPSQPTTTVITADTPDPSLLGDSITVIATVSGSSSAPLDGRVVFTASTGETCTDTTATTGSSNSALFSCAIRFNSLGTRSLIAAYLGSPTHDKSSSVAEPHTCNIVLQVAPASLPNGSFDIPYNQTVSASAGGSSTPFVYTVSAGNLPAGLNLVGSSGVISGTPTAGGSSSFEITATDSSSAAVGGPFNGTRSYTVVIMPVAQAPLSVTATPGALQTGATATLSTQGGSGTGAVSYAVSAGAANCSIDGNTLTATAIGTCTVTASKATDGNYTATTASVDIGVSNSAPAVSVIGNQSIVEDSIDTPVPFSVSDVETAAALLTVTATSSDQSRLTDISLAAGLGGSGANRSVLLNPIANANGGPVTVTLNVADSNGGSSSRTFIVDIVAVNDPPSFSISGSFTTIPGAIGVQTRSAFVTGSSFGPPDEQSSQSVQSYAISETADPGNVVSAISLGKDGNLSYTLSGLAGSASFSAVLSDNGGNANGGNPDSAGQSFSISVPLASDLQISKSNGRSSLVPGSAAVYEILVANAGPNPVSAAQLQDSMPSGLNAAVWSCTAVQLASCPAANGTGDILQTLDLPINGILRYTLSAEVSAALGSTLTNTATLTPPANTIELDNSNNQASDTDIVVPDGLLRDGFESPSRISVEIPGTAMQGQ